VHVAPCGGVGAEVLAHLERVWFRHAQSAIDTTEVVEPACGPGKGDGDPPRPALALAAAQSGEDAECQEIAGRMVERLAGEGDGVLHASRPASVLGEPAHHLHEAVEAATVRPGSRGAICGQPADDEPRSQGGQPRRGIVETAQGTRPVAVDDDVRGSDHTLEGGPAFWRAQVEPGAALAEAAV